REVVLWSTLKHPHIIPFLGVTFHGQNMEIPTAVMPWYENGSLDKYLPICRDAERLSFVCISINPLPSTAVQHLHLLEIAHGDIKAQNVLISSEHPPRALLTDFGLSRPLNGVPGFETSHVQGTLHFMAPELLRHLVFIGLPADRQCTKETDIWAFGMFIVQVFGHPQWNFASSERLSGLHLASPFNLTTGPTY
ncbi:kinase-like domain-containing protein, partial [Flagelloscypha sp. PMI_526]